MATTDYDDNEGLGTLGNVLSPLMMSGVDPNLAMASGNPQAFLAAQKAGVPYQPPLLAATRPVPQSALAQNAVPPQPSGSSAIQTPAKPVVPGNVTPTGSPASAFARPDPNAIESNLVSASAPQSATNPTGVPMVRDPNHPEYKPTAGRRIIRGVVGGLEGLAEGGIRGSLLGALDPTKAGATAYGAGTRQFSQAAQRNAMLQGSLQQQLAQGPINAQTTEREAKAAGEQPFTMSKDEAERVGIPSLEGQPVTQQTFQHLLTNAATVAGKKDVADINADSKENIEASKESAQRGLRDAQAELDSAKADLARAGNDPNSPAYKLALKRATTAQGNQSAAMIRANAYALNATGSNLGTTPGGTPLPGSTLTTSDVPIGSKFQSQFTKHEGAVSQFNDVGGALDNLEKAARSMVAKGQQPNSTLVAAALAQPEGTATQWVQGEVAKANLTPEQRDYVINLVSAHENLQALRKAGGLPGSTETQVNRLIQMLPNASTPDLDYFLRQTGQIKQTRDRLAEGIPRITGGTEVRSGSRFAKSSGNAPPQSVVDGMKEGQYVHGPGGSYQKVNGRLVSVQGGNQ